MPVSTRKPIQNQGWTTIAWSRMQHATDAPKKAKARMWPMRRISRGATKVPRKKPRK